jgi:hypothetical protein
MDLLLSSPLERRSARYGHALPTACQRKLLGEPPKLKCNMAWNSIAARYDIGLAGAIQQRLRPLPATKRRHLERGGRHQLGMIMPLPMPCLSNFA